MFLRSFGSKRQSRATMSKKVIMFLRPFGSKRQSRATMSLEIVLMFLCSYV